MDKVTCIAIVLLIAFCFGYFVGHVLKECIKDIVRNQILEERKKQAEQNDEKRIVI